MGSEKAEEELPILADESGDFAKEEEEADGFLYEGIHHDRRKEKREEKKNCPKDAYVVIPKSVPRNAEFERVCQCRDIEGKFYFRFSTV